MARLVLLMIFYFVLHHYDGKVAGRIFSKLNSEDPDANRNVSGLITSKGYPVEEHTVQTEDGYLLSVQRIPFGRKGNAKVGGKKVVLLIHGAAGDATNWVFNFPNQSLGFILADNDCDVWLLNTRGCTYSKKHVIYTTRQKEFWDFSFDELAQFDVPNTIDYILQATGKKKLYIIGHSQGTTATFAMLSDWPEYNDKVKLFLALAPVTSNGYTTSIPLRLLVPIKDLFYLAFEILTDGEFLPNDKFTRFLKEELCGMITRENCADVIFSAGGVDRAQLNFTRLGVYAAHFPSGTSAKSVLHYLQMIESKEFRKFDYGPFGNLRHYNQEKPPVYDVSRITAPIALFWSVNDLIADPIDVDRLRNSLKSLVYDYEIPYPYNHYDFVVALNANKLLYEPILQLLSEK